MRRVERACLQEWRGALLADAAGSVVEIGAGTGANLAAYPAGAVDALWLCEPDAAMRRRLARRVAQHPALPATVLDCGAERLPLAAQSVDLAVATLVLCTVPDPPAALAELHRVLRPGGELRYLEHVAAPAGTRLARWQHRLEPLWRRCAGGCRLTRRTSEAIAAAAFDLAEQREVAMRPVPAVVRQVVIGRARRLNRTA
ncbi:MAG: class I SAM-dependent methyltransferase [Planctomycetes bacterium]|nr:class I SAM-dependent methyltransferase [Planctomycetota bacterium]